MAENSRHPTGSELVRFADGELDQCSADRIREHMSACAECRTRIEEFETTLAAFVRHRNQFVVPADIEPTRPWMDIRAHLEQLDRSLGKAPVRLPKRWSRLSNISRKTTVSLTVFCAAAATWMGLYQSQKGKLPRPGVAASFVRQPSRAMPDPQLHREHVKPALRSPVPLPVTAPADRSEAETELQAIACLHALGADLGDPVELRRDAQGNLVVTAVGLLPERRAALESALSASVPSVRTEFSNPVTLPQAQVPQPRTIASSNVPWQAELDNAFQGRENVEQMTVRVLQISDALLARAHALRDLDSRFGPDRVAKLRPSEREVLERIRSDHFHNFSELLSALRGKLKPLFSTIPGPGARPDASGLFSRARHLDELLNSLLGGAVTDLGYRQLVSDLHTDLTAFGGHEP